MKPDFEKKADDIIEKLRAKLDAQIYAALDAGPLMIGTTTRTSANAANLTAERFNQMVTGANRSSA